MKFHLSQNITKHMPNPERIYFATATDRYSVPNRYELLSSEQYLYIMELLARWSAGELSPIELQALYVCHCLGLKAKRIDAEGMPNLYQIASAIDFILEYDAESDSYKPSQPLFAKQLLPALELDGTIYQGYAVNTAGGMLSIGLSSLAFIDALDLLPLTDRTARLRLALTLYNKEYNPAQIHELSAKLADRITPADELALEGVAFNFAALAGFLFRLPHYEILVPQGGDKAKAEAPSQYRLGLSASLYRLCSEGLGSKTEIEQMPVLDFLEQLRMATIQGVRRLNDMGQKLPDIAEATGLSIAQINRIINS